MAIESETDKRLIRVEGLIYIHGSDAVMIVPFPEGKVPTLEQANPQLERSNES
jgi:hypothetical protein